jgi:hypothetical protein
MAGVGVVLELPWFDVPGDAAAEKADQTDDKGKNSCQTKLTFAVTQDLADKRKDFFIHRDSVAGG